MPTTDYIWELTTPDTNLHKIKDAEAMRFKGTLGTDGTITSLPTASASNHGDSYKVITDGTYASQEAHVGDWFTSDGSDWILFNGSAGSGTTYTFADGVNSFTVTPNGGTAQTVNVTPSIADATTSASGLMSATDKDKLDDIASGAEVNQNAFSNIKVGNTTIKADTKTDTLELTAGSNITITPDDTNDKVTISATDTNTTYTLSTGTDNGQIKVTPSTGSAYDVDVKGLGSAAYKDYTTSVTQNSTDLVTSGAVWSAIDNLPEPMVFKGTLGTGGTITELPTASASNEGYTYKVITAGTYASQSAKVGDVFVSCKPEGASAYSWVLIPAGDETFTDTWRAIKVNGTEVLGNGINTGYINHINGTNTTVAFDVGSSSMTVNASDEKVTSVAKHYTPSCSGTFSANASGATAAWSIDVVKGVTLQKDAAGHITGVSVTSGKIPANPNTDRYVNSAAFADDTSNNANSPVKMTLTRAGSDTATVTANIPKVSSSSAGVAPKGTAVSSQSQTTKFLREDGTWAAPSYTTNTDTKNTAGSTNSTSKLFLIGATTQAANPQTYSNSTVFAENGNLTTGKKLTSNIINNFKTGTGEVGKDAGSSANPRYFPTKWTFDFGQNPSNGDIIYVKLPCAGHDYGDFISIDNGTTFYPVAVTPSGTTSLRTHYGNGAYLSFVFDPTGQVNDIMAAGGANARSNITGGCWRVVNYYDSGNNYDRNRYNVAIKAWGTKILIGNLIVASDGVFHHLKEGTAFDITYPILYLNADCNASATTSNVYDCLAINLQTTQTITLTTYKPVYIKGTLAGEVFTPVSTTPLTQTEPTTDDGYYYIYLGQAYSTTNMYLEHRHPVYAYKNGAFGEIVSSATNLNGKTENDFAVSAVLTNENLNSVVTPGFYRASNSNTCTNKPENGAFGLIVVKTTGSSIYLIQMFYTVNGKVYRRYCIDNTWISWTQDVYTDTNNRRSFYGTCDTAAATAAKTVTISDTSGWELKAGTIIGVKFTNSNSASNVTLDVNGSGAKSIYYNGTAYTGSSANVCGYASRITYYMYDGSTYWMWLSHGIDLNDNNYDRNKYVGTIKCGTTAITKQNIIVGKDGVFHHLKDGTAFDINYPILYAASNISADGTGTDNYDIVPMNLQTTQTITLTAYKPVYIKGTLTGRIFTPVSTTPLTQTIPADVDNYHYMLLGVAYSTTNIYLDVDHRIFAFYNGAFGEIVYSATNVNGYTVAKSVPSNAVFTDANVTQTATTTNALYEVLFSATADNTTRTEATRKDSKLRNNPSTGILHSNYYGSDASITSRLTSLNFGTISNVGSGRTAMRLDLASSAITTGTPPAISGKSPGGYVQTYYWDSGSILTQLYIPNGDHIGTRNGPQGLAIRGYDATDNAWSSWNLIPFMTETPTTGQVAITDGTLGGIKSSGYTIAKSVPSNADFNDTKNTAGSTDTSSKIFLIGATSQAANPQTYSDDQVYTQSGTLTANNAQAVILAVSGSNNGGISLHSGTGNYGNYGLMFRKTENFVKHGYVQGDWAMYFNMDSTVNRGWMFRNSSTGGVASISNTGNMVLNGSITIGGNAANTSGARMEFNNSTNSIDFIFN